MLGSFHLSCLTTLPFFLSVNFLPDIVRGKYGWKFNNSLLYDDNFPSEMRNHLHSLANDLVDFSNPHLRWEFFKYEARKFSIAFSKRKKLEDTQLKNYHEKIISDYTSTDNRPSDSDYAESKAYIDSFFEKKTQGAILRSKCNQYEHNEKSSKYFLSLQKKRGGEQHC